MEEKYYLAEPGYKSKVILIKLGKKGIDRRVLVELGEIIVIKPYFANITDNIEIEI